MVATATNNVQSSTGATLQSYRQKFKQTRNIARTGKDVLDQLNTRGRIRNQPLAQRQVGQSNIGVRDKDQLAERQQQLKATKDGLKSSVSSTMLADRRNKEFYEGQEMYKNRSGIENAATADRKQLMDRQVDKAAIGKKLNVPQSILDVAREKAVDSKNDNVMNIKDLRRKRGNLAESALTDRTNIQDAQREAAPSVDQAEMRDVKLSDRTQSGRKINLMNQHSHEDRINNVTETNRNVQEHMTERESVSRNVTRRTEQSVRENVSNINNVTREQINETINQESENTTNRERGNRTER